MTKPRFFLPQSGKPPSIKIIGDPDEPGPWHAYQLPQPKYGPGDLVVWTARWPRGTGDSPAVSRLARVSKVEGSWGKFVYHLRLVEPVEYSGGRRWAYDAPERELSEPSAVDRLGRLTA